MYVKTLEIQLKSPKNVVKNVKTKNYYKVKKKKQQKINRLHLNILNLIYINNMYIYLIQI